MRHIPLFIRLGIVAIITAAILFATIKYERSYATRLDNLANS
ncbi:hypothetical protein IAD21_03085 [Abditibacteriota bacterium]|nr:hypothetical protein IAD21_03085 [Abditibacteriota bacterium]